MCDNNFDNTIGWSSFIIVNNYRGNIVSDGLVKGKAKEKDFY